MVAPKIAPKWLQKWSKKRTKKSIKKSLKDGAKMVSEIEVVLWGFSSFFELFFGIGFFWVPRAPQGPNMNDFGSQNDVPKPDTENATQATNA